MNDLSKDLLVKIKNLYEQKKYSKLETIIENFKNFEDLPVNIQMTYAASKALNPKSKINDYKKSAFLFEKIYLKDKSNLEPLYNLIIVSLKANLFSNLNSYLEEVHKKKINDPKIIEGLSKTNFFLGNMVKATMYYEKLSNLTPNSPNNWTKFLGSINYHQNIQQDKYLSYCKKFDKISKPSSPVKNKILKKKNIINLGFFSPDFKTHSVSFFLKGLINNDDNKRFKFIGFSNLPPSQYDSLTKELKKKFDHWEDISGLSDEQFIQLCVKKDIDILIDLAGFTNGNRVNAFRGRCAPIQILWLGYCNSLGVENMDYIIADKNLIKKNEKNLYSEKIIYMPQIWNVLSKPKNLPEIDLNISKNNKTFTFGSLSNFQKISSETIKVWSKILNNTDSKLILKSSINNSDDLIKNLKEKFLNENVNLNKIDFYDRVENQKVHLEFYNKFNLTLDTFPYPGVTTSFESILMGKPVLTMKGNNFNSRCGESININLGLDYFIANDENDYYNKALGLIKNYNKIEKIGNNLRNQALGSPLLDIQSFSKNFYDKLHEIYTSH
jgi:protein O-GlcNAc transferase